MKRVLRRGAIAAATLAVMSVGQTQAAMASPADTTAIVGVVSHGAVQEVARDLRHEGLTVRPMPRIDAVRVVGDDIAHVRELAAGDPRVRWIEPPLSRSLFVASPSPIDSQTGRAYGWAVDSVGATQALAMVPATLPVTVAVVDSGLDVNHPDLAGRIGPAYDVLTEASAVRDVVGHGTFVTGLISAIDGNGLGSRGVAGATKVLPIRITTTGAIKSTDAALGIIKAVDSGVGVVNLSFGGPTLSEVERSALAYAADEDVLVVAAAGNSFLNGNAVQYPAAVIGGVRGSWSAGLSVAASDPLGRHAPFSTANDFVSVAAPGAGSGECGDGVFSTIPAASTTLWDGSGSDSCTRVVGEFGTPTGRYGYGEGTSFAAPIVSGAAALARDVNPELTAEQTGDVIRRSAHQTIGFGWNSQTGAGVLDVGGAVALARVYDTAAPIPALTVAPKAGSLSVVFDGRDTAGPQSTPSGVASYRLERSSDGTTYTPVGTVQSSPIRVDDVVPVGEARWYRGTVCDRVRNCASALSGAVISATTANPRTGIAATIPPGIRSLAVGRPGACRNCARVAFTGHGTGPLKWAIAMAPGNTGVKRARRTGTVPADGRVVASVSLSRIPTCRARMTFTISVSSPYGATHSSRRLTITGACAQPSRR